MSETHPNQPLLYEDPLVDEILQATAEDSFEVAAESAIKLAKEAMDSFVRFAHDSGLTAQQGATLALVQENLIRATAAAAAGDKMPLQSYLLQLRALKEAFRLTVHHTQINTTTRILEIALAAIFRAAGGAFA